MDQNDILKVDQSDILHVIFEYHIFFENPIILSIGSGSIWLTFMKSPNGSLWIIMDQNIILSWSTCKGPYNFFAKFLYPGQEHSSETEESNGKNGFWKFEVFTIENHLQKFLSIYTSMGTKNFAGDFRW